MTGGTRSALAPVACAAAAEAAAGVLLLGQRLEEHPWQGREPDRQVWVRWRDDAYCIRPNAGPDQRLLQVDASRWPCAGQRFAHIVVTDWGDDLHPLACLDAWHAALAPGGVVHVRRPADGSGWSGWSRLAERAGWTQEDVDDPPGWAGLRKTSAAPRWRLAHALPRHYPEIAALFKTVFGHELSEPLWRWKYGDGRGNAVLVWRGDALVAHYGGMYRDVLNQGVPERVAQIGDVMVAASERGVLTRNGPFAQLGMTWPEVYGPKGYGFPTDRHFRIAEKLGIYARAGEMIESTWPAASVRPRWSTRARHVRPGDAAAWAALAALWQTMKADFADAVIGVRSAAYLEHRYMAHPHNRYDLVLVQSRWSGRALGAAALRRHADHLEWLDYIGPLASLPAVVDQLRRLAALWGQPRVIFWSTDRYAPRLAKLGAEQRPLGLLIPASSWPDASNPTRYAGKWWLTAGDTDFR